MADLCYGAYNRVFFPIMKDYALRHGIDINFQVFDEHHPEYLLQTGAMVVIARGLTAKKIARATALTVVEIPIFFEDLAKAIVVASKISKRIAIVSYGNIIRDISELNPLMEIEITQVVVNHESQLLDAIKKLKEDGIGVIIGGKGQAEIARQENIPYVLIEFSETALNHAFDQAFNVLETLKKERRKQKELYAILNNSSEGFIAINECCDITLINRKAVSLLSTDSDSILGKSLIEVFPEFSTAKKTIKEGITFLEKIIALRGITVIYSILPLHRSDQVIGATILFREINEVIIQRAETRKKLLKQGFFAKYQFEHIIGQSPAIRRCKEMAQKYALTDSSIFIFGETGVGKELFAQSIHNNSSRKGEPFVAINCSTLPENILESELFGYEKGTFTGALQQGKAGLFELADRGTIFLDEITEMSSSFQAKLLRVLQERQVLRLGSNRLIPIDVRVIAATNIPLQDILENRHIREDLFYRLNVLTLIVPPLRERLNDIPSLIQCFYPDLYHRMNQEVFAPMMSYSWPGNIRQLLNFLEKLYVLSEGKTLTSQRIQDMLQSFEGFQHESPAKKTPTAEEIQIALTKYHHHYSQTAQALGIHRSTLWRLMKKYKL